MHDAWRALATRGPLRHCTLGGVWVLLALGAAPLQQKHAKSTFLGSVCTSRVICATLRTCCNITLLAGLSVDTGRPPMTLLDMAAQCLGASSA